MEAKEKEEFNKSIEEKLKALFYQGVVVGFKTAYQTVVEQIDIGLKAEQLKEWAIGQKINVDVVMNYIKEADSLDKHGEDN